MTDRNLQWLAMALLLLVAALAVAGALRWDVLKLWLQSLLTPRQEPHLTLQPPLPDRHRHAHRHPHDPDHKTPA